VAYARESAFVPRTRSILARLGYPILNPDEFDARASGGWPAGSPHLYLAEEHCLGDVPDPAGGAETPIIVLTGRRGIDVDDRRIVAAVSRPAGLHDLYCILQRIFEPTPRATPRIPVTISVDCGQRDRHWTSEMVSLSENGALLRTDEKVSLGSSFQVEFELPDCGHVALRAEAAYQIKPDLGIVFSGVDPAVRNRLASFIQDEILAA
jgi:hypothetical protein